LDDDSQNHSDSVATESIGPVRVTGLSSDGAGVGRLPDGRVVFVEGGVPGDLVELVDLEIHKKLGRARIGRVLEASRDRVEARCAHFGSCGGCLWQHVRYEAQLEAKRTRVRDALVRIGGFDLDDDLEIIGSPDPYAYRSRARLIEDGGHLGYRQRGSHSVEAVRECPILVPAAQEAMTELARSLEQDVGSGDAARHDESPAGASSESRGGRRRGKRTKEWIVTAGSSGPGIVEQADGRPQSRQSASVSLDFLGESIRAGGASFIQGNALLWETLATIVRDECSQDDGAGPPTRFVELYAGIGFLTLPLVRQGLSGVAIESDRSAYADLVANLRAAGFGSRVEALRSRAEARRDLPARLAKADLLLADPPRAGLAKAVRDSIVSHGPKRLVYVSCDPATLARDLRGFREAGYRLASARALDLFPQTPHVEVVARLERLEG